VESNFIVSNICLWRCRFGPEQLTDAWQPLDAGVIEIFHRRCRDAFENLEGLEKLGDMNESISARDARIAITKIVSAATKLLTKELVIKACVQTGISMSSGFAGDEKIKIQAAPGSHETKPKLSWSNFCSLHKTPLRVPSTAADELISYTEFLQKEFLYESMRRVVTNCAHEAKAIVKGRKCTPVVILQPRFVVREEEMKNQSKEIRKQAKSAKRKKTIQYTVLKNGEREVSISTNSESDDDEEPVEDLQDCYLDDEKDDSDDDIECDDEEAKPLAEAIKILRHKVVRYQVQFKVLLIDESTCVSLFRDTSSGLRHQYLGSPLLVLKEKDIFRVSYVQVVWEKKKDEPLWIVTSEFASHLEEIDCDMDDLKESDVCFICEYEGNLLCCSMCPRAFHLKCLDISNVPIGDYFCTYCSKPTKRSSSSSSSTSFPSASSSSSSSSFPNTFYPLAGSALEPSHDVEPSNDADIAAAKCSSFSSSCACNSLSSNSISLRSVRSIDAVSSSYSSSHSSSMSTLGMQTNLSVCHLSYIFQIGSFQL